MTATKTVTLSTGGMFCTACGMLIETALSRLDGVEEVKSDFATETTTVSYDPEKVTLDRLVEEVEEAGYEAKVPV